MIEDINAQSREDIYYDTLKGVLLYHNTLNEYPLHWQWLTVFPETSC